MNKQEQIVRNYIDAYNKFDIEGMLTNFDDAIHFQNIADGQVNLELNGIEQFRQQAEEATHYFSERTQTIKSLQQDKEGITVEIAYFAVLAQDMPWGLKKGEVLQLEGKSVFTFSGDKIVELTDIS